MRVRTLVRVEGIDDEVKQLADLSLEAESLGGSSGSSRHDDRG